MEIVLAQRFEFDPQHLLIPSGVFSQPVVGDHQRAPLRLAQVIQHDHRHFAHPELPRGHHPRVARNDDPVGSDQHGVDEAKFGDRGRDLRHLLLGVRARIPGVGNQPLDGPALNLEIRLHFLM
jgi:hypothetical protein